MRSGFRERLAELVGEREPFKWAAGVGIPSSTFDRIWNKGTVPTAPHLLRIAQSEGVTVDWLLTGEGPKTLGEVHSLHALHEANSEMYRADGGELDHELLRRAVVECEGLVETLNLDRSPLKKAAIIISIYDYLRHEKRQGNNEVSSAKIVQLVLAA